MNDYNTRQFTVQMYIKKHSPAIIVTYYLESISNVRIQAVTQYIRIIKTTYNRMSEPTVYTNPNRSAIYINSNTIYQDNKNNP